MKTFLMAASAATLAATGALAADEPVKLGVLLGFTGPIESLAANMGPSAELAVAEINESGAFMDGTPVEVVTGDTTCVGADAATAAAERLITSDGVAGIVGGDCSGVTAAILTNVAMANGTPMISPSATSPALSDAEDDGLFFRTAPSDARQGQVLADVLMDKDIKSVAVTYTNNDYGKGFADAFAAAYEAAGGSITTTAPHEDGKADYAAEVGALSSAGGDALVVLGYADQGGKGVIQAAYDSGAFDMFVMGDGMYSEALLADMGDLLGGSIGTQPWAEGEGADAFVEVAKADENLDAASTYTRESYDAAALLLMAMQAAGSTKGADYKEKILEVANAPGEKILPGELGKALKILAEGGDVDYVGGSNVELINGGEAAGTYREYLIKDGAYETVKIR